jgi:hypothetical protein
MGADNIVVMPARALTVFIGLLVAACGGQSMEPLVEETASPTTTSTTPNSTQTTAPGPVWEGFEATVSEDPTLAAYALGPLDVYESPTDPEPWLTLDQTTILESETVVGVLAPLGDGWVEVMLPVRPNGSTGWVRSEAVALYVVDSEIVVDLSDRQLTYLVDGIEVVATEVGIGSDHNQTPIGQFFVTDNVTLSDPNSPWGPHALGISARSDTITEFNGGDGIIGIHGTNNATSIGGNVSLGCVRVPNDMISLLHQMVPLGTRVTVRA